MAFLHFVTYKKIPRKSELLNGWSQGLEREQCWELMFCFETLSKTDMDLLSPASPADSAESRI